MIQQFVVPVELQQLLTNMPSKVLSNVLWDKDIPADPTVLPLNPNSVRRMLCFSKAAFSSHATPTATEYNCYLETLDAVTEIQITFARGN